MCGIIAQFAPNETIKPNNLHKALIALRHRGPDGEGIWISDDQTVGLGHARLAIIGINNGAQPISNEDQSIHAIVNGEFYDFERIRADLQLKGHVFATQSDSEILLHLYEEYDVECLQFLRGEFAFTLWDSKKRRLFAARDRFGIKPLLYNWHNGKLSLASEAKALFAAGVKSNWDEASMFDVAHMQYAMPGETIFQGVKQVRPGHFLLADETGNIRTECYWDLNYPEEHGIDAACENEKDAIDGFRDRIRESIRLRLRSDIPVCCHISGGLDSASILGFAAELSADPVHCFTVTFSEESYDELHVASRMAQNAGAILHPVVVSQSDIINNLEDAVYFSEGFAVNGHLPAKYLLHQEISRQGFKVALTGEGSDEIAAGYAHLRSDLFTEQGRLDLVTALNSTNTVSKGIMLKHGHSLSMDAVQKQLNFVPAFLQAKGSLGFKLTSLLDDNYKRTFTETDSYKKLLDSLPVGEQVHGRHKVNQSLYLWTKTALANYILRTLGDGTEMAHSVEGRVPFLDHKLFEFVRALPISMKINDTTEKYVLREAARHVITDEIYLKQKHPFVAPPLSAFSDKESESVLQDELRSDNFRAMPFFDSGKLLALLDRLPSMSQEDRSAWDPILMTALSAAAINKRFGL